MHSIEAFNFHKFVHVCTHFWLLPPAKTCHETLRLSAPDEQLAVETSGREKVRARRVVSREHVVRVPHALIVAPFALQVDPLVLKLQNTE